MDFGPGEDAQIAQAQVERAEEDAARRLAGDARVAVILKRLKDENAAKPSGNGKPRSEVHDNLKKGGFTKPSASGGWGGSLKKPPLKQPPASGASGNSAYGGPPRAGVVPSRLSEYPKINKTPMGVGGSGSQRPTRPTHALAYAATHSTQHAAATVAETVEPPRYNNFIRRTDTRTNDEKIAEYKNLRNAARERALEAAKSDDPGSDRDDRRKRIYDLFQAIQVQPIAESEEESEDEAEDFIDDSELQAEEEDSTRESDEDDVASIASSSADMEPAEEDRGGEKRMRYQTTHYSVDRQEGGASGWKEHRASESMHKRTQEQDQKDRAQEEQQQHWRDQDQEREIHRLFAPPVPPEEQQRRDQVKIDREKEKQQQRKFRAQIKKNNTDQAHRQNLETVRRAEQNKR
jgi:hypothetical protein